MRNQACGEKCAWAMENAFVATICFCGSTSVSLSLQMARTVSAVISRRLTSVDVPFIRYLPVIP